MNAEKRLAMDLAPEQFDILREKYIDIFSGK